MSDPAAEHDVARHWERVAAEWMDWARTPGHDAFWAYRAEFREFLPAPGAATLDIGCGEGRISRELTDLGHHVTAADISATLLDAAHQASSAARYVHADAADLPFDDDTFDRVVSYNMLMDVADMPAVVAEAARVLAPGGILTIGIVHPLVDIGTFSSPEPESPYVIASTYYGQKHVTATQTRDGRVMHFAGWSRPLEAYVAALEAAGLAVTTLREPRPDLTIAPGLQRWDRLPLFLWMRAQRAQRN
jgi:ubiquinone/menaquinone biosynthesis C-methylase UbiE